MGKWSGVTFAWLSLSPLHSNCVLWDKLSYILQIQMERMKHETHRTHGRPKQLHMPRVLVEQRRENEGFSGMVTPLAQDHI